MSSTISSEESGGFMFHNLVFTRHSGGFLKAVMHIPMTEWLLSTEKEICDAFDFLQSSKVEKNWIMVDDDRIRIITWYFQDHLAEFFVDKFQHQIGCDVEDILGFSKRKPKPSSFFNKEYHALMARLKRDHE